MSQVLAFDFGASGGRAILAKYDAASGSLKYEEIHRFENGPMDCGGKLCWDFPYLLAEIKKGIEKACEICGKPDSLAFDTWGVDYGLIDGAGKIMGLPITAIPAQKICPIRHMKKYRRKSFMQPREIKLCP